MYLDRGVRRSSAKTDPTVYLLCDYFTLCKLNLDFKKTNSLNLNCSLERSWVFALFFKTRLITNNAEEKSDAKTPEFRFIYRTETEAIHPWCSKSTVVANSEGGGRPKVRLLTGLGMFWFQILVQSDIFITVSVHDRNHFLYVCYTLKVTQKRREEKEYPTVIQKWLEMGSFCFASRKTLIFSQTLQANNKEN